LALWNPDPPTIGEAELAMLSMDMRKIDEAWAAESLRAHLEHV